VVTVPDPTPADNSCKTDRDNDADSPDDRDAAATTPPHNPKFTPREQHAQHPGLSISFIRRAGTHKTKLSRSLPGSPTRMSPSSLEEDPHARSFTDFKRPSKRARQGSSSSSSLGISTKAQPPASHGIQPRRPHCQRQQQQQQFGVIENRQAQQACRDDPRHTTEMVLTSAIKARAVSAIMKIVTVAATDAARHVALQLREHRAAAMRDSAAAAAATPTIDTARATGTADCDGNSAGAEAPKPSAKCTKSAIRTVTIQAAGYVTDVVGNQLKVLAKKLLATAVPKVATNCAAIVAQLLKPDSVRKIMLKTAMLLHITLPRAGIAPGAAAAIAKTVERLIQARTNKPPAHVAGLASRQCAPVILIAVQPPVSHAGKENTAVAAVSMVE